MFFLQQPSPLTSGQDRSRYNHNKFSYPPISYHTCPHSSPYTPFPFAHSHANGEKDKLPPPIALQASLNIRASSSYSSPTSFMVDASIAHSVENGAARHTDDTSFVQITSDTRRGFGHMASALGVWFTRSGKHRECRNAR